MGRSHKAPAAVPGGEDAVESGIVKRKSSNGQVDLMQSPENVIMLKHSLDVVFL